MTAPGNDNTTSSTSNPSPILPHDDLIEERKCRDPIFSILFLAHLIFILFLAFGIGIPVIEAALAMAATRGTGAAAAATAAALADAASTRLDARALIASVGVAIGAASVSSITMLFILATFGGVMINFIFIFAATAQIIAGALLASTASPPVGAVLILLGILTFFFYFCTRARIAFAAAHVEVAAAAIAAAPTVVFVAIFALLSQAVCSCIWALAAVGLGAAIAPTNSTISATFANVAAVESLREHLSPATDATRATAAICLLLSFFWISVVIREIVAFIAASLTGTWWMKGAHAKHTVARACCHALTYSLGSLAIGGLFVGIVRTMKFIATAHSKAAAKGNATNICARIAITIATLIVTCIASVVEWANEWAIVVVALTGFSFIKGGTTAATLFKNRGLDAVVNQSIIGATLVAASLLSAAIGAAAGGAAAYTFLGEETANRTYQAGLTALCCFFIGYAMTTALMPVISASTRAVFVLYALSPRTAAITHPEHLQRLASAWALFHPETHELSGYNSAMSNNNSAVAGGAKKGTIIESADDGTVVTMAPHYAYTSTTTTSAPKVYGGPPVVYGGGGVGL